MRKLFIGAAFAATLCFLASCRNETVTESKTANLKMNAEIAGNTVVWSQEGQVTAFVVDDKGIPVSDVSGQTGVSDGRTAFSFRFDLPVSDTYTLSGIYPSSAVADVGTDGAVCQVNLPATQAATAASCDPGAVIMTAAAETFTEFPEEWNATFKPSVALNCITLVGFDGNVDAVEISVPEGKALAGKRYVDLSEGTAGEMAGDVSSTVRVTYDKPVTESPKTVWFTSWETSLSAGEEMTVTVFSGDASYSKTITAENDCILFRENALNSRTVDMSSSEEGGDPSEEDAFLIGSFADGSWALMKNSFAGSSYIEPLSVNVTKGPGEATFADFSSVISVDDCLWTFEDVPGGKAVKNISAGTYVNIFGEKKVNLATEPCLLEIIDNGDLTYDISVPGQDWGTLQYNSGAPRFTTYKSSQKPLVLIFSGESSGGDPVPSIKVDENLKYAGSGAETVSFSYSPADAPVVVSVTSDLSGMVASCSVSGGVLEIVLDENQGEERTAELKLSATGYVAAEVTVVQKAKDSGNPDPEPGTGKYGWYELPAIDLKESGSYLVDSEDASLYYAYHLCDGPEKGPTGTRARNYTVCFSAEHHCPVWVAAPRHKMYESGASRTDAYKADPSIPASVQYSSKSTGGGCNKGHMLGSAERLSSTATNRQVFYYSNIAPQRSSTFNTGGGGWNILEDWVDKQVCSDTLYVVIGAYFDEYTDARGYSDSPEVISYGGRDDVSRPTMFYYLLLRTKSGNSGKALKDCTASEIKCAAFVRSHNIPKGTQVGAKDMMSVSDLEKITGFEYFANVPQAPKDVCNPSDWGL